MITAGVEKKAGRIIAQGTVDLKSPVPFERKAGDEKRVYDNVPWVPFFEHYEQYPDFLATLAELSPTHYACLRSKTNYCLGDGFAIGEGEANTIFSAVKKAVKKVLSIQSVEEEIKEWAKNVNNKGETLRDIAETLFLNKWGIGNYYLELVRGAVGKDKVFYIYAHKAKDVRVGKKNDAGIIKEAYISRDFQASTDNKETFPATEVGFYPNWVRKGNLERTVIHVKENNLSREYYGIPSCIASLLWQQLEYRIPSFNIDEFNNGFMPSVIATFFAPNGITQEEADKILSDIKTTFTGIGNQKKVFAQIFEGTAEEYKADIHEFSSKKEGNYGELGKEAEGQIIKSHGWHPSLAGIPTPGKLGNMQEMRNALLIAYAQEIKPAQDEVLSKVINPAMKEYASWMGKKWQNAHLTIANSIPVTFFGELNPADVLTDDEQREVLGFAPLEPGQVINKKPTNAVNNSAGSNTE